MRDHELLTALAAQAGGVFTRTDARRAGWTPKALHDAVVSGAWRRLERGVYVDAAWYAALPPRDRHLVELRGRLLVRDDGWHAARLSAAIVHGLPLLGRIPAVPTLVRDRGAPTERGSLASARIATLPRADRASVAGLRVTSLARTAFDVARAHSFAEAVVVADAALRAGLAEQELVDLLDRCQGWPGAVAAREALAFADGRTESVLESLSRVAFRALRLPAPEPQVEVWHRGRLVARVDFLWRDHLVVRWGWDAAVAVSPDLGRAVRRGLARGSLNTLEEGVVLRSTGRRLRAA